TGYSCVGTLKRATTTSSSLRVSTPSQHGPRIAVSPIYCGSVSPTRSSARRSTPMSCGCGDLPSSFDRVREIWDVDFEFPQDENGCPVPVAMFAKDHRTGAELTLRRDQLLASTRAPFDVGPDTLVVGYSVVAELSCFRVLRWPLPRYVLCTYFETSAAI